MSEQLWKNTPEKASGTHVLSPFSSKIMRSTSSILGNLVISSFWSSLHFDHLRSLWGYSLAWLYLVLDLPIKLFCIKSFGLLYNLLVCTENHSLVSSDF